MAAVRRSLFDNAERAKFLNHVVTGVKRILQQNAQVHSIALSGFWRLHYSFTISCFFLFFSEFKWTEQLPRILSFISSFKDKLPAWRISDGWSLPRRHTAHRQIHRRKLTSNFFFCSLLISHTNFSDTKQISMQARIFFSRSKTCAFPCLWVSWFTYIYSF